MFSVQYQLPSPKVEGEMERQLSEIYVLIWALSTIVPPVYMGLTAKKDATLVSIILPYSHSICHSPA